MDIHNDVRILVTGATGFIGRNLIPALQAAGHDVVAGTRHPETYDGPADAELLDLETSDRIGEALDGCDAAFYLIHSMATDGDFEQRDRSAAEAFADSAKQRHVRVVYLGGLGGGNDDMGQSAHLRSRHEVGRILRDGSDAVELQAAIVIGAGSTSFEILRQLVDRLPVMVCPRWVTTRCQPIGLDDVVRYLVAALVLPAGRYEIGGSQVLTYEEMMLSYARITGRRRLILKVPVLSTRLSSHWIGLVTDQPAPVARPLAEGLSVEVVVTDDRIRRFVDLEPVDFETAVRRALK